MTREQAAWGGLRRGLAFVLPTPQACSCGLRFSQSSFGHTGFTGTSLWVDRSAFPGGSGSDQPGVLRTRLRRHSGFSPCPARPDY